MVYIGSVGNYNLRFFAGESLQTLEATVQDIVCLFIYRETSRKSGAEGVYSERTRKEVIYQESVLSKLKIFFVEGNVLCKKNKTQRKLASRTCDAAGHLSACRTCSTIIFPHSTYHLTDI